MRFVLIGHPVAHSLSPAIHGAAYKELGLDHRYELVDAPDEAAVLAQVDAIRSGEIAGANVTVPWKRVALRLADQAHPLAEQAGAANVLVRDRDMRIIAYNTDALALADEFGRLAPGARNVAVIGSGGAALGAVLACRSLGIPRVGVTARRWHEDLPATAWPNADEFVRLGAEPLAWPESGPRASEAWHELTTTSSIIIQATSAGMHGADAGDAVAKLVPWSMLAPGTIAYDLVYIPTMTPFLRAADTAGVRGENGLSMLVGQAALAIELWLGVLPPREPLLAAALRALSQRA